MKLYLSLMLVLCASVAGAQTIFTADPTYDYSNNEVLEGIDTLSDPGDWLIAEQINNVTTSSTTVTLYVSSGLSYSFSRTGINIGDDIIMWTGQCTSGSYPNGIAYLTVKDGIISGQIKLTSTFVTGIKYIGDDHYIIYETADVTNDCDAPLYSSDFERGTGGSPGGRIGNDCSGLFVYRLILAYTPQFATEKGTQTAINAEMKSIVDNINDTYISSGLNVRARLALAYKTSESETGNFDQDFHDFTVDYYAGVNGSKFDQVTSHEIKFKGDASALIISQNDNGPAGRASSNFNRVLYKRGWSYTNFGVAHEIGHLFGLEHNIQEYSQWKWVARLWLNRKKAYGFRTASKKCVMSYGDQSREHVYSATDLTFSNSETAGDSKAQGRNYIAAHMDNVIQHDDPEDFALTSFTFTADMTSHLFAYEDFTTSGVTVDGATVKFEAYNSVKLQPNTWIKSGSNFQASIKPCENTTGARILAVGPESEPTKAAPTTVKTEKSFPVNEHTYDELQVYPNPASSTFNASIYFKKPTDVKFTLRDVNNNILSQSTASGLSEFIRTVDTSTLPKGVYFVEAITNNKRHVKKVAIQ